jgi:hypothetical protein
VIKLTISATTIPSEEIGLPPADEFPVLEPPAQDKTVLASYLISAARRLLNPTSIDNPEVLSTAIQSATRRLAVARFLLQDTPENQPITQSSSPDWLQRAKPENQAAFHEWVRATFLRVFRLEKQLDQPFLPVDAPSVRGLTIYAARSGETRFYGAWTAESGVFIGWMRIQPQVAGIDSEYAVGEILGRAVFNMISIDLSGHAAIDKFVIALKEAAWDLGLADG